MEQHAVPQDITGFKFKLVGDMTLKQFGELAFGLVMAYLFFASNWHPLLKWPLAIFFAFLGVALAFIPIEERPLDIWIINFFRAIYRPTYYVWKRDSQNVLQRPPVTQDSLPTNNEPVVQAAPKPTPVPPVPPPAETSTAWPFTSSNQPGQSSSANSLDSASGQQMTPSPIVEEQAKPAVPPEQKEISGDGQNSSLSIEELMKMREQKIEEKPTEEKRDASQAETPAREPVVEPQNPMTVEELMQQRTQMSAAKNEKVAVALSENERKFEQLTEENKKYLMQIDELRNQIYQLQMTGKDIGTLQQQLDEILKQKSGLMAKIAAARDEITQQKVAPLTSPSYQEQVWRPTPKTSVSPGQKQQLMQLTSLPNVVNGLVLDSNGVPLDGTIIIIKDKDGNSIRALRTNKVGQFIASTPLIDGTYYLELEKPNYSFEAWEIHLSGFVMPPIEIRPNAQTAGLGVSP